MAREVIDNGTTAGDGTGESLFTAFEKVNNMTEELYYAPGYAELTLTSAQTINNNTTTVLLWGNEVIDNANIWNPLDPGKHTISGVDGTPVYEVSVNVIWSGNTSGRRSIYVHKNGSPLTINAGDRELATTDGAVMLQTGYAKVSCAVGDYFEVKVDQVSGSNLTITARCTVTITTI